jgi:hypothetical protein
LQKTANQSKRFIALRNPANHSKLLKPTAMMKKPTMEEAFEMIFQPWIEKSVSKLLKEK